MAEFTIYEAEQFRTKLRKLGKVTEKKINKKLTDYIIPALKTSPHIGPTIKKLKGYKPDTWRIRFGDFRIFYIIDNDEKAVYLITVDDRKNAYR